MDLIKGLKLTAKQFWKRKITIQYPEECTPKSSRFRGLHALLKDPNNGKEKCVGCKLCAEACPVKAIKIETKQNDVDGSRYASKFEVDLAKCFFCGLCERACPMNAIVQTKMSNCAFRNKNSQLLTKEILLKIGTEND